MRNVSRRDLVLGASIGAVTIGTVGVGSHAAGAVPPPAKLWTLEGELKVHAKFVYRFFLVLLDGQKCALYGADHRREPEMLASLKAPVSVRVRGTLGTEHHSGGTQDNPSPFPAGWWVYMDVHEVEVLK